MALSQTISIEAESIVVGELERFVTTVLEAGAGVHAPVKVTSTKGSTKLEVAITTEDEVGDALEEEV